MAGTPKIAQDAAEAMIERDRNTDAIVLRIIQATTDEVPIVQNIVVRQGGALGMASRGGAVLNIDRMVELNRRFTLSEFRVGRGIPRVEESLPGTIER